MILLALQPKIQLSLKAHDTTIMHRAGMTGFWMSLKTLEQKYPYLSQRPGDLTWNLTPTSISLDWHGEDFSVLNWLIRESFKLDSRGLIHFTALETLSLNVINKIHIHKAINETFLRLNHFYRKREIGFETFRIGNRQIVLKYWTLDKIKGNPRSKSKEKGQVR